MLSVHNQAGHPRAGPRQAGPRPGGQAGTQAGPRRSGRPPRGVSSPFPPPTHTHKAGFGSEAEYGDCGLSYAATARRDFPSGSPAAPSAPPPRAPSVCAPSAGAVDHSFDQACGDAQHSVASGSPFDFAREGDCVDGAVSTARGW